MAQQNPTETPERRTVDIDVYYLTYDTDSDGFQLARDIRGFVDSGLVDGKALEIAYDHVASAEMDVELHDNERMAEAVYHRMQGGRVDDELGYEGHNTRSMAAGDVIVIDGEAYFCARIGFESIGAFDDLQEDDDLFADADRLDYVRISRTTTDESGDFRVIEFCADIEDDEFHRAVLLRGKESGAKIMVRRESGKAFSAPEGVSEGYLGAVDDVEVLDLEDVVSDVDNLEVDE